MQVYLLKQLLFEVVGGGNLNLFIVHDLDTHSRFTEGGLTLPLQAYSLVGGIYAMSTDSPPVVYRSRVTRSRVHVRSVMWPDWLPLAVHV